MKKFENPEIEVQIFAIEDIVTTSIPGAGEDEGGGHCPNETDRD